MHSPPRAPDQATGRRWMESRRRRRLLEGVWKEELQRAIERAIGPNKAAIWGEPDLSKNVLRSIVHQLSTLYNVPATIGHDDQAAADAMADRLHTAGLWEIMQGFSPLIIGQREGLVRAEVVEDPGHVGEGPAPRLLLVRVAPADLVSVEAHPDAPDMPIKVCEYRVRADHKGEPRWYRDVFDLTDPAAPSFRVEDEDGREVGTDLGIPPVEGDAYRAMWSTADGRPFIPGEWYHAQRTGKIADPYFGRELVDGTLTVAMLWTFWGHMVRDASHPQRYAVGTAPASANSHEGSGMQWIETDPSSLLRFEADPGVAVQIGQFSPGGDPVQLGAAIRDYASDLATDFDISPSDLQRANGDARSGFAISLTREGMRHAQRRYEPSFNRHDTALVSKIAAMLNRAGAADLPESGYRVAYHGLPLSLEERRMALEEHEKRLELGIASRVDLLMRLDGISEDEARRRLIAIRQDAAL